MRCHACTTKLFHSASTCPNCGQPLGARTGVETHPPAAATEPGAERFIFEGVKLIGEGERVLNAMGTASAKKRLEQVERFHVEGMARLQRAITLPGKRFSAFKMRSDIKALHVIAINRLIPEGAGSVEVDVDVADGFFKHAVTIAQAFDSKNEPRQSSMAGRQAAIDCSMTLLNRFVIDMNASSSSATRLVHLIQDVIESIPKQVPAAPRVRQETARRLATLMQLEQRLASSKSAWEAGRLSTAFQQFEFTVGIAVYETLASLETDPKQIEAYRAQEARLRRYTKRFDQFLKGLAIAFVVVVVLVLVVVGWKSLG